MSLIVEFRLWSRALVLGPTLDDGRPVTLDLETEVAIDPARPYLIFWARGDDVAEFEAAMADDPTVAAVERYNDLGDCTLYRIQASEEADVVSYRTWVEIGVNVLRARWSDGWWHVRMRFPDRAALATAREWFDERDVSFYLERIFADDDPRQGGVELTPEQRQVLRTAHDLGYFEIPRAASMADVAAELEISSQAVSERLRRGYRRLVAESVL